MEEKIITEEVLNWLLTQEYVSISKIQKELSLGFNRSGKIFIELQKEGLVSLEVEGKKGTKVNIDRLTKHISRLEKQNKGISFKDIGGYEYQK